MSDDQPDLDTAPDAALEGLDDTPHTGEAVEADGTFVEPQADDFAHAEQAPSDPEWFKRAVFYEVLVRAFADGAVLAPLAGGRRPSSARVAVSAWGRGRRPAAAPWRRTGQTGGRKRLGRGPHAIPIEPKDP